MENGVEHLDESIRRLPHPPLRVLVVAEEDAFNRHLLRTIAQVCTVERVLTVAERPALRRVRAKHLRAPVATATTVVRSLVFGLLDRRTERRVARLLPDGPSLFEGSCQLTPDELRGERGAAVLAEVRPDLLVLSGAPMLPASIFTRPRLGTVNLHCGLSRHYRGTHTIFYPFYRREYDAIGATLHQVDAGIDTGAILAEARPALQPSDTFAEVWASTALEAAAMTASFLEALAAGPVTGRRVDEPGVLVRNRDRRVWHHVHHAVGRRLLARRPPAAAARTQSHYVTRDGSSVVTFGNGSRNQKRE